MTLSDGAGRVDDDDRAVSSVIGTILMVALVVVVTAGVALTVFGIVGEELDMVTRVIERVPGV